MSLCSTHLQECVPKKIDVHRNTVNLWYGRIRQGLYNLPDPPMFSGEVEVDESYFEKRKTGLGRAGTVQGQIPVFGLRERRSGLVAARVVTGTKGKDLIPLICQQVKKGSIVYSDGHGAYCHLKSNGYRHRVIYHDYAFVFQNDVHTNSIESF